MTLNNKSLICESQFFWKKILCLFWLAQNLHKILNTFKFTHSLIIFVDSGFVVRCLTARFHNWTFNMIDNLSHLINRFSQGPLYEWTEHSVKFHFWNYKVGGCMGGWGTPITPWGWMGVDSMDLNHNTTQNIHIKIFLMRGQNFFFSLVELGF